MKKTKDKKKRANLLLIIAIIAVVGFGGAFAYYAREYYLWRRDGRVAQENTDMVMGIFQDRILDIGELLVMPTQNNDEQEEMVAPAAFTTVPLNEIRELTGNPDIVAFVFIEGTAINNVVVQGPDNEFYLYRDMYRNLNVNGSIFLDYRNSPSFNDPNTIIYGHNMNNGTMFHNLRYYIRQGQDFFEQHPRITVITDTRVLFYDIFSVFQTNIDFDYIQVDFKEGEFEYLLNEIIRRRAYNTGVMATADDNILILSTCTNVTDDTRIVVAARLAEMVFVR